MTMTKVSAIVIGLLSAGLCIARLVRRRRIRHGPGSGRLRAIAQPQCPTEWQHALG